MDLNGLTFCDSTGLAMFLSVSKAAAAGGAHFEIAGTPPRIRQLFGITGIDAQINIVDEKEEFVAPLDPPGAQA